MSKERELLEKLYYATERLDEGFITAINSTSEKIVSGMNGDEYDAINDILIEVAEYLGIE